MIEAELPGVFERDAAAEADAAERLERALSVVKGDPLFPRIDMAKELAALEEIQEAARRADPVLLEPMMAVEVRTPEDYMGEVIGDLNSRRGHIQSMEDVSGAKVVRALVPLSEMFGYVGDLRSKTQGRAVYTMQFDSYSEVPRNVAEEIVKKARGE